VILQMTKPVQAGLIQEKKFEIISNHLANADTDGFKGDILTFDEMLRAKLSLDLTQGDIKTTGNKLDLALTDEGFFKVQTSQGLRYTRNGNFSLNGENVLVTQSGDPVMGEDGPITIDGTDICINEEGEVISDGEIAGKLKIVTFKDMEKLQKDGLSLFVYKGMPTDEMAPRIIAVKQGALESANVSTVVEMTKMVETMRLYESFQKIIQSFDEADAKAINELGKSA
jgi:flagellar basal-body rod protein FlgF